MRSPAETAGGLVMLSVFHFFRCIVLAVIYGCVFSFVTTCLIYSTNRFLDDPFPHRISKKRSVQLCS